ncbi:MAG: apolipoprotein N-acyltransferase, partial [Gammaproteobacteria bacterium]
FAIMAGYLAITCMVCNGLTRLHGMYRVLVVFPLTWILIEWLRGYLFSGFAWLSVGYSQIGAPLSGFAPLGGVSLVSLLTVISGGLLLMLFGPRREKTIAIALLLVTWTAGAGLQQVKWTSPAGDPIRASLVQANISQDQKWLPEMFTPTLIRYDEMTRPEFGRDFIIWPEVAIPALYHDYEDRFFKPIAAAAARKQSVILTGTIFQQADGELFNGLTALGSGQFYRKQKLVPFGEYFPVPDRVRNWLRLMNLPYTDFSAGAANQPLLQVGGTVIGTSICYEILFGNQIRRTVPAAQLLINISNDAWFGRSTGPAQHLEIARMRALETGRYLLRATGTGITAVIRPDGQLDSQLPAFTRGVLRAEVLPMQGATPFVRWGDWPLLTLAVLVLGISWRRIS